MTALSSLGIYIWNNDKTLFVIKFLGPLSGKRRGVFDDICQTPVVSSHRNHLNPWESFTECVARSAGRSSATTPVSEAEGLSLWTVRAHLWTRSGVRRAGMYSPLPRIDSRKM